MQPIKFGGLKKVGLPPNKAAQKPKPARIVFGEDEEDAALPAPLGVASKSSSKSPLVSTASLSRAQKAKQAAELELDSSVYEYDEVYDNMKEGSRLAQLEKKKESGERKVSRSEGRMQYT